MNYRVPTFPATANIWRFGNAPPNPPDVVTPCQLLPGRRAIAPYVKVPVNTHVPAVMHMMCPPGTDIRDGKAPAGADTCECPAQSGRLYNVAFVDDIGLGFSNEHRFAMMVGVPTWPIPFPHGTVGFGPHGVLIASGGSLGVAVNMQAYNFTMPAATYLLMCVTIYNQAALPLMIHNGNVFPIVQTGPGAAAGGVTSISYQLVQAQPAGPVLFQVIFPGALVGEIQWQAIAYMGGPGLLNPPGANAGGGAGNPNIVCPITLPGAAMILDGFGLIGAVPPYGFSGGYADTGGTVTDLIGGLQCDLVCATKQTLAVGAYPCSLAPGAALAWDATAFVYM